MSAGAIGFGRFSGVGLSIDHILGTLVLATLVAIPIAGTLAALGFLVSGLALSGLRPGHAVRDIARFWPLLALPFFCVVSTLWSEAPRASFRFGMQLGLTMLFAIILARRIPARSFLIITLGVLAGVVVLCVVAGTYRDDTGALKGFYASKNAMGSAAAILALIAAGFAFAKPRSLGLLAIGGAGIGLLAVVLAQSVSALLALAMAMGAVLALRILRPLPPIRRAVTGLFVILLASLALILAVANFDAFAAAVLALTGKDVTLTGRTDLWAVALDEIARRPLLGVGYQAFWIDGNPTAEAMWRFFGIATRTGFHFHNTYLSNAVELGLVGAVWQTAIILAAVIRTAQLALARRGRDTEVLFGLMAMIFVLTPVDVPVFFQFNLTTVLLVAAIVYANDGLREIRRAAGSGQRGW